MRNSVVLPQPEGPKSEKNSLRAIEISTLLTALTAPKCFDTSRIEIKDSSDIIYTPEVVLTWTPRRRNHSAKLTSTNEATRIQAPSANTLGSLLGKRNWLHI